MRSLHSRLSNGLPLVWAGWLVALCVLGGCAGEPSSPARDAAPADTRTRQAALSVLDSLRQDVFRSAFENLDGYAFTRHVQTQQLDPNGAASAQRERVLRYDWRNGERTVRVERADSSGRFDFGLPGWFVGDTPTLGDVENAGRHVVSEEPPYLAERSREAFSYRLAGDTLMGSRRAHVIVVRTRPGADDEQAIEQSRLYVDEASSQLVGVHLTRQSNSLLLDERSDLGALLQPMDTTWVPAEVHAETHFDMPLLAGRIFRMSSVFSEYAAMP